MSVIPFEPFALAPAFQLRPAWVRPLALAGVIAAHAVVFVLLGTKVEPEQLPSVPLELSDLPYSEPTPPPVSEAEPPPMEEVMMPDEVRPPPDPYAMPPEMPPPVVQETPKQQPVPVKPRLPVAAKPKVVARPASPRPATTAEAATPAAPAFSGAAYGALVSAQLQRHLAYPSSASGAGAVGVTLSIGPSGHAISVVITSSSGNAAFDAAVRQAGLAVQAPPPPGGHYIAHTTIRFRQR